MKCFLTYGLILSCTLLLACSEEALKETPPEDPILTKSQVIDKVLSQLVHIPGGEFMMGTEDIEFRKVYVGEDAYLIYGDMTPSHLVRLNGYSIAKYLTPGELYNNYLRLSDYQTNIDEDWVLLIFKRRIYRQKPAMGSWQDANAYCSWLGQQTGLPFGLPTEAQWEYAASSRGQYPYATANGKLEPGVNFPTNDMIRKISPPKGHKWGGRILDVTDIPVNPLGIHQMGGSYKEWVHDWYDVRYYQKSPVEDPQGSASGDYRSVRGFVTTSVGLENPGNWGGGGSVYSRLYGSEKSWRYSFRCVINSDKSLDELKTIAKAHLAAAGE